MQNWILISWSVASKNGIYLGSAGQGLIWYLHKCIYYNIVTVFILTSIHFYFTLLAGNFCRYFVICCLFWINLLHVYSFFIITTRESNSLDPDQVWHIVGPDLVLKLFAKVISRQQLQAKRNFSSVYLISLQGST